MTSLSEAERALRGWGIDYKKQLDGVIVVEGNIDISFKQLEKLPDLSHVVVRGNFACQNNLLKSLKGAPQSVGGYFWCFNTLLKSLEGAPKTFKSLNTPFGIYTSWNAVPEDLRLSAETKEMMHKDQERKDKLLSVIKQSPATAQPVKAAVALRSSGALGVRPKAWFIPALGNAQGSSAESHLEH